MYRLYMICVHIYRERERDHTYIFEDGDNFDSYSKDEDEDKHDPNQAFLIAWTVSPGLAPESKYLSPRSTPPNLKTGNVRSTV